MTWIHLILILAALTFLFSRIPPEIKKTQANASKDPNDATFTPDAYGSEGPSLWSRIRVTFSSAANSFTTQIKRASGLIPGFSSVLMKLALPISIIIAAVIFYLAITAKHRHCMDFWTDGSNDPSTVKMAEMQCHNL